MLPLAAEDEAGSEEQARGGGKGEDRHDPVVVQDHKKGSGKAVERDDDGGQPADSVGAHGADVVGEAVQDIAALVTVQSGPVSVDDLVEDVPLDVVADFDSQLQHDAAQQTVQHQAEEGAAHVDDDQDRQLGGLVAGNDVDDIFAGYGSHKAQGGAQDAQEDVEDDGALVALGISKDPLPVVDDLLKGPVLPALAQLPQRLGAVDIRLFLVFVHEL